MYMTLRIHYIYKDINILVKYNRILIIKISIKFIFKSKYDGYFKDYFS